MVFQRSALLLLAAAAAVVSTNALSIDVESNLKNPVVKNVQQRDGKVILTLEEGKGFSAPKKHYKKKHQVKKPVVHHKKQVSETRVKDEVVKTYPHGKVQISTKKESKPVKKHHKKQVTVAPKPVEKPKDDEEEDEEDDDEEEAGSAEDEELEVGEDEEGEMESFGLPVGDSVDITVDGETVTLKHFKNGSVVMYAGGAVTVLDGADIYLDFDVDDKHEAGSASGSGHGHAEAGSVVAPKDTSLVSKIEADVSSVAKKFSELATKLTGNGFKEATPIILIGGAIGALAAVVGIAAVAVGRARASSAAADPQSVLADATEDVEADIEAGETEEKKEEDEAADETQALDSSDSESESEAEQEEGKFTNEVASV